MSARGINKQFLHGCLDELLDLILVDDVAWVAGGAKRLDEAAYRIRGEMYQRIAYDYRTAIAEAIHKEHKDAGFSYENTCTACLGTEEVPDVG